MGNKINPRGLRLGINQQPSARWYADVKDYPRLLGEDDLIREIIEADVGHSGIARIDIERAAHNINVTIHTAKPGVVIGRGGESIKALRARLDKEIGGTVAVNVQEVPNPNTNAEIGRASCRERVTRSV